MRSRSKLIVLACMIALFWPNTRVLAQQSGANPSSASKPKKRTNIDFEDQLIQGDVKKPELFYLLQKKQFNFGKLIRLRENFLPEMQKTSEDIQKAGP